MKRWKIIIPDSLGRSADIEKAILGKFAKIVLLQSRHEKQILSEIKDADAILLWHEIQLTHESIICMEKCKVIVRVGAGFDNVDIVAAAKKKIPVCNVPDYGINDVADHTMALLLAIYRNLEDFTQRSRNFKHGWCWKGVKTKRFTGETLGIIGLGRIGTAVALRSKAFGVRVIFYDPYVHRGIEKSLQLVRKDELKDLLKESDIISFHVPLTEETRNMADKKFFSCLKPQAVIINTARGGIIDLDALYQAMKKDVVRAAGLDVLPAEPPDERNKLIKDWENNAAWITHRLLITPHSAFYSEKAYQEMRVKAAQEVKRVLQGKRPLNCVNAVL